MREERLDTNWIEIETNWMLLESKRLEINWKQLELELESLPTHYKEINIKNVTIETLKNAPKGAPVMMKAGKDAKLLRLALKIAKETEKV